MEKILDFLANYYIIFILITVFLIFSLIGFFIKREREKNKQFKIQDNSTQININSDINPPTNNNEPIEKLN